MKNIIEVSEFTTPVTAIVDGEGLNETNLTPSVQALANRTKFLKDAVDTHAAVTNPHGADASPTANRMVLRDANGRSKIAGPAAAEDIATKGYVDSVAIGVGQTWQNVTASRAVGVTYTNSTGRPIMVVVAATVATNVSRTFTIDGFSFTWNHAGPNIGVGDAFSIIVPAGSTYSASSFSTWLELR